MQRWRYREVSELPTVTHLVGGGCQGLEGAGVSGKWGVSVYWVQSFSLERRKSFGDG